MLRSSFGRPIRLPDSRIVRAPINPAPAPATDVHGGNAVSGRAAPDDASGGRQDYDRPVAILYIAATFAPSRSA
jgi:hypothetical protein